MLYAVSENPHLLHNQPPELVRYAEQLVEAARHRANIDWHRWQPECE